MAVKTLEVVAAVYGVSIESLQSKSQKEPLPEARKMVVYFMQTDRHSAKDMANSINRSLNYVYRIIKVIEFEITIYKATRMKYNKIKEALGRSK